MPPKSKRITVFVPVAVAIEFKARAAEYSTTMSEVIKKCIQQYLATHPPVFVKTKEQKKEID